MPRCPKLPFWLLLVSLNLPLLLTACGQKGPLYLPEPEQAEQPEKQ